MRNKIILALMVLFLGAGVTIENSDKAKDMVVGGFSNMRGFTTLQSSTATQVAYQFGVVDIPI